MSSKRKNVSQKSTSSDQTTTSTDIITTNNSHPNNNIPTDELYKFIDLYYKKKNIMFSHLYNSFDKLLDEDIPNYLMNTKCSFFEKMTKDDIIEYGFEFSDIAVRPPFIDTDNEIMLPQKARINSLTYASKLIGTVKQYKKHTNIATGHVTRTIIGNPEHEYHITNIPIMVRSKYCALSLVNNADPTECKYDPGGYFIVKGNEKVILSLERMIFNKPLVFIKKEGTVSTHTVQINSKSYKNDIMQITNIVVRKDASIIIKVSIFADVSAFILMRALGIESDSDIINYCVYDRSDVDMMNLIRMALEHSKTDKKNKILSQNDAQLYLMSKIKIIKKYSPNEDQEKAERKLHLLQLLRDNFLPHVESDNLLEKGYYVGYMINRLLQCYLGRVKPDDRDNYINKNIELPGQLIFEIFKQYFKKTLNECNKFFKKRNQNDDAPLNIITQIKPSTIELGLMVTLSTGTWNKRKGVAQPLPRFTYQQTLTALRRINSPSLDASTNKITGPRHLHPSVVGPLCYIEVPEGAKVGLVKNLSLIGTVTVIKNSQKNVLKNIIKPMVMSPIDIPPKMIGSYTRVHLNGNIIGLTNKPRELYNKLKEMKFSGTFDPYISISHCIKSEIECSDIRINCDSGRIIHPTLRVVNNTILLTQEMIDLIDTSEKPNPIKISTLNEFMVKFPGVIEYIDTDEKYTSMLAVYPKEIEEMRQRMIQSIDDVKKLKPSDFKNIVNRYDEFTYIKYTHCEIHPSLLIGIVASNIPFADRNAGTRNMFQYSQAKQALGIFATNYRHRLDISYMLYHSQRPIVTTRSMKYTNCDRLPAGENIVLAIACYTGYNQEDSNLLSESAIDRGLFRSTSFKKEMATIQKNQATSQDDIFIKPDVSQVTGIKHGTYDNINEQGYAPEETVLQNGDIILAKLSPIQPTGPSKKIFKDSSVFYKAGFPGVVDRVFTGIINHEGYEMRKTRTRSMRTPIVGDKFCSKMGQKGVNGIQLGASDMLFTELGMTIDEVINPNCMPSRMTMGQLVEEMIGKIAACEGHEIDGTIFNDISIDVARARLKLLGFNDNGCEDVYNGMTGKKLKHQIYVGPCYYQRLKHMVADKIHCLTMDHEVLTFNGWKLYDQLTMDDEIATLKDGKLVYEKPIALLHFPNFVGKLYNISNQQIDLSVTDNHRMWVSKPDDLVQEQVQAWQPYELVLASELIGKHVKYQKDAVWDVPDYQFVFPSTIDERVLNMDAWITFFGIWIVKGCATEENYSVEIYNCKESVMNILVDALIKLGYKFSITEDTITVNDEQLHEYMKNLSVYAPDKQLPEWVWKLNKEQCQKLIFSMMLGDEIINKCYYTSSIKLRDDFVRLCLHAGYSGNFTKHYDLWKISIAKNNPVVNDGDGNQVEELVDYNGPVFCLQVASEVFYVRRNGKGVWTGNSRCRGPQTQLTRQPPEGRALLGGLRAGEMERDSMIAHGIAKFLKERLLEVSDVYHCHVCNICGLFASRLLKKGTTNKSTSTDIYYCQACKNYTDISKIRIPYAFKLLIQELLSINICPRIVVKKDAGDY